MNRHHPYGRGGFEGGPRRGGHQGSLGPDRSHHFSDRGGGPSRGRGGWRGGRGGGGGSYGGYSAPGGYDNGPQGDTGGYGNYESGPQDSYYQNGSYGSGMPEYGGSDQPGSYDQEYGDYEDGPGNYGPGGQGGYGRGGANKRGGGAQRRHIEIPESIIEERIQRERPCRTLFIRNVKYETPSEDVRRLFEEHGEIKTFFDLIANRGMVFVTYYDLRAAERARERLQGSEISGRPIDVHYSLPRDDKNGDKEKNQQLQGTLLVTLRDSPSGQQIDDSEVRRKFIPFGEIREVRQTGERPE
ncbi:hypothetical protein BDY19DRAFT_913285 [Irpex rosettiformis]|uniref:Uncharacterized protein n=1 Tax=Irpex rosettiformis TaxID=378272 RepID=A0ACB8UJM2_9APHY|nr:hypothetical protein BDY19DRAFT_913285 [Irpex rosettiformis]